MTKRPFVVWRSVKSEHGNFSYAVTDGMLICRTHLGSKSMKFDETISPELLARVMCWEIDLENAPDPGAI